MSPNQPAHSHPHGKRRRPHFSARLRHAALTHAPVLLSGGRLSRVRTNSFVISQHIIPLAHLPHGLDGLRIVHLSDLHIGKLVTPAHLPGIVKSVNELKPDLIAVTGDFVDLSLNVLPQVIKAMSQLTANLGVYFVPGNHDYLDDGQELIKEFQAAQLKLLLNQSLHLIHNHCQITIAGIDWALNRRTLARLVKNTLKEADAPALACEPKHQLRLLLAHNPDAFDFAVCRHVDLTLSGHTHGGQLVLKRSGRHGAISLGRLAFKYPQGLYRKEECVLHVTTGVGSWFPFRMKCAAEIALLTLQCLK